MLTAKQINRYMTIAENGKEPEVRRIWDVLKDEFEYACRQVWQINPVMIDPITELMTYRKYIPTIVLGQFVKGKLERFDLAAFDTLMNNQFTNTGKRWEEWEDETIVNYICNDEPMWQICCVLGRTESSIRSRLSTLVGRKRISKEVAGRFVGTMSNDNGNCYIKGTVFEK